MNEPTVFTVDGLVDPCIFFLFGRIEQEPVRLNMSDKVFAAHLVQTLQHPHRTFILGSGTNTRGSIKALFAKQIEAVGRPVACGARCLQLHETAFSATEVTPRPAGAELTWKYTQTTEATLHVTYTAALGKERQLRVFLVRTDPDLCREWVLIQASFHLREEPEYEGKVLQVQEGDSGAPTDPAMHSSDMEVDSRVPSPFPDATDVDRQAKIPTASLQNFLVISSHPQHQENEIGDKKQKDLFSMLCRSCSTLQKDFNTLGGSLQSRPELMTASANSTDSPGHRIELD
ncbi:hypothetical protein R3P38DRAFT_2790621 [Favolaschia claudopus]|uniref:Uncharacterized protein n=1 Tax=Favolaschia claudopus TaxID=2862362 RepID=A0AAW0AI97_9AGAR